MFSPIHWYDYIGLKFYETQLNVKAGSWSSKFSLDIGYMEK